MKKILLPISFVVCFFAGFSQSIVQRSTGANTLVDPNLFTSKSFRSPIFSDTTAANAIVSLDSTGKQIFTRDVMSLWVRVCCPKRWQQVGKNTTFQNSTSISLSGTGETSDPIIPSIIVSPRADNILEVLPDGVFVKERVVNGLNSGGDVLWVSGYTYDVTPAVFGIAGIKYTTPATEITLQNSDPTYDRRDAVVGNNDGTVSVITGTPAEDPVDPTIDPSSQVLFTYITVTANSVAPIVEQAYIYFNNTEWAGATSTARINLASTNLPFSPLLAIRATNAENADNFRYTAVTSLTISDYNVLTFKALSQSIWLNTSKITFQFYNSSLVATGLPVNFGNNTYGFASTNLADYQTVAIPLTEFGALENPTNLLMTISTVGGATISFQLDNIQLQQSFVPSGSDDYIINQNTYIQEANASISGEFRSGNITDLGNYTLQSGGEMIVNNIPFGKGATNIVNSLRIGGTLNAAATLSTVVGLNSTANATFTSIFGYGSSSTFAGATIFGYNSTVTAGSGVAMGYNNTGVQGITIGHNNTASALAIILGSNQTQASMGDVIFGYNTIGTRPQNFYPGGKSFNGAKTDINIRAVAGTGTNDVGQTMALMAGPGSGNGTPGSITFSTAPVGSSGTTVGTLVTRVTIKPTGQVQWNAYGLNTFAGSPAYGVGVDASGNLVEYAIGGGGSVTSITVTQPAAGFTITNSGVAITTSGTRTFALADDLAAVEGISTTGPVKRTASNTWTAAAIDLSGAEVTGNLPVSHLNSPGGGTLYLNADGNWTTPSSGGAMINPMTTAGDIIYSSDGSGTPTRLPIGTSGQVLRVSVGGIPEWFTTAGAGTVTSVAGASSGIFSYTGSPITGSGTLTLVATGTSGGIPYFSAGTTLSSSALLATNAIMIGGGAGAAPSTTTTGTGVLTALGVNVGSAGAFITFNGAAGTPSSITLTNGTGLPVSTGISGLGTGVATALAVNTGSSGAFVVFNGALGTPTSGTVSTGVTLGDVTLNVTGTDATGDIYYRSAGGLLTRVGIGSSGQILTVSGGLPVWSPASAAGAASITGTANQVFANGTSGSAETGAITLTLPQDIHTSAIPTFRGLLLSGGSAGAQVVSISSTATSVGILNGIDLLPTASGSAHIYQSTSNQITEPGSGTAPLYTTMYLGITTVTAGGGLLDNTATLYIQGAMAPVVSGNNYAIWVDAGPVRIDDIGASRVVQTDANGVLVAGLNPNFQTLTDGATIVWNVSNGANAVVTLSGTGRTLTILNPVAGQTYVIRVIQGSGGSKTITTWPSNTKWPNGTAPTLSTTAGDYDIITLLWDGTNYYAIPNYDFS